MTGGHGHQHHSDITALAYSYTTSLIASADSAGRIVFWDFELGRPLGASRDHPHSVTTLHFCDPFPLLLSSDAGGMVRLWSTRGKGVSEAFRCLFTWDNNAHVVNVGARGMPQLAITATAVHIAFETEADGDERDRKSDDLHERDAESVSRKSLFGFGRDQGPRQQRREEIPPVLTGTFLFDLC